MLAKSAANVYSARMNLLRPVRTRNFSETVWSTRPKSTTKSLMLIFFLACHLPEADGLRSGPSRNYLVFDPLDFLAEFTQHIPPKGAHLVRYYGWYSNKARGMRRKAAEAEVANQQDCCGRGLPTRPCSGAATEPATSTRCSQTWAMLIKRVYEVDPLMCARCGGEMKVVAFIEPPRGDVIEKILRHCGLWDPSTPRAPPPEDGWVYEPDADWESQPTLSEEQEPGELTYVDIDEFLATF